MRISNRDSQTGGYYTNAQIWYMCVCVNMYVTSVQCIWWRICRYFIHQIPLYIFVHFEHLVSKYSTNSKYMYCFFLSHFTVKLPSWILLLFGHVNQISLTIAMITRAFLRTLSEWIWQVIKASVMTGWCIMQYQK